MYNNSEILDRQLIREVEDLEEYQEVFNSKKDENINLEYSEIAKNINIVNLYFREVRNIPLLKENEEIQLGEDLKLIKDVSIVLEKSKNSNECVMIDLDLVFRMCCNNKEYDSVIKLLLLHFGTNENIFYKNLYPIILKYANLSKKLGRALSEVELKKYFDIENNDNFLLKSEDLVTQVENYLRYKNAFDRLFCSNLRLVTKIASKYNNMYTQILDLINEGNIGLMTAIKKYDVSLGYKFSTYATWWITHNIRSFSINQRTMVKVPFYLNEEYLKFKKDVNKLQQEGFFALDSESISKKLNLSLAKVEEFLVFDRKCKLLSLNYPVGKEEKHDIGDYIKDDVKIEDVVIDSILKYDIKELYKYLTDSELEVIKMRFGLDNYCDRTITLKEIGKMIGVSPERVRQIESKALTKMRRLAKNTKCRDLIEYLN